MSRIQKALSVFGVIGSLWLLGCTPRQGSGTDVRHAHDLDELKQQIRYDKVVVLPFEVAPGIPSDGEALAKCRSATIDALNQTNVFTSVEGTQEGPMIGNRLIIRGVVEDLNLVGTATRILIGVTAGRSRMRLRLVATDALGKTLGERTVVGDSNEIGAALTWGVTDRSVPSDTGVLAAQAIMELAAVASTRNTLQARSDQRNSDNSSSTVAVVQATPVPEEGAPAGGTSRSDDAMGPETESTVDSELGF